MNLEDIREQLNKHIENDMDFRAEIQETLKVMKENHLAKGSGSPTATPRRRFIRH